MLLPVALLPQRRLPSSTVIAVRKRWRVHSSSKCVGIRMFRYLHLPVPPAPIPHPPSPTLPFLRPPQDTGSRTREGTRNTRKDRPTFVLLHGLAGSTASWDEVSAISLRCARYLERIAVFAPSVSSAVCVMHQAVAKNATLPPAPVAPDTPRYLSEVLPGQDNAKLTSCVRLTHPLKWKVAALACDVL